MMTSLLFMYNNAAGGANTYTIPITNENGQARNANSWTSPKKQGITRVIITGANGNYITISRNAHQADNLGLAQLADTLADAKKTIQFQKILGGKGVIVDADETLSITATMTGNGVISILVELDDAIPTVNAIGIVQAGVNAVATGYVLQPTGANISTGMDPKRTYRLRGTYFTSTTILGVVIRMREHYITLPGQNAVLTGQGYTTLADNQADKLTGTGSEFRAQYESFVLCSTTDAAAVQRLHFIFEVSG